MMKNYKYCLFFGLWYCFFIPNIFGQIHYGSIDYEITVNLHKRFPSNNQNNQRFRSPRGINATSNTQYLVEKATLYFNDTTSIFLTHPPESMRDLNRTFLALTQINYNDKTLQTHINLFGEDFFIEDSLPQRIWKFTSKERLIAGKMAKQAITKINDSTTIYAWFDPDFFYSIGPESYSGLPGAILGLAYEDGSITYFAQKIDTNYPEMQGQFLNLATRNVMTRKHFITTFNEKYNAAHRYYQLIKDMLVFF